MQHEAFSALCCPRHISTSLKKNYWLVYEDTQKLLWREEETHLLSNRKVFPSLEPTMSYPPLEKVPLVISHLFKWG
jgi:hypothetical protein